jgi:AmmeMemoRadiSam system protein A
MALSFSIDFNPEQENRLLEIARKSIEHGFARRRPLAVEPADCEGALGERLGSFVTLTQQGELRGCVGTIQSEAPLAENVATAAFNAAFNDRRFAQLMTHELVQTQIEISVISPPEPFPVADEAELIATLVPHEYGLILAERQRQAVFLPQVWEKVTDPAEFVRALKQKAGLGPDYWSDTMRCFRIHTKSVTE